MVEKKVATFEIIHTQGTKNLVEVSKAGGVQRFIYISALGARENARSRYHKTKWEAERAAIISGMEGIMEKPPITTQQLIMLQEDNICDISEMQEVFNLKLVPFKEALKTILPPKWRENHE